MLLRRLVRLLMVLCLGGCHAAALPAAPLVVTLGDSVPAGTACGCTPFPDRYARMRSPEARSLNFAQPGFTADDVREGILDSEVVDGLREASVVLVMVGANDMAAVFGQDRDYPAAAERVRATVTTIVGGIRQAHGSPVRILVLGYWNVVKDGAVGRAEYGPDGVRSAAAATRAGNAALQAAAAATGASYLATDVLFKGADRAGDPTGLLAADGDHPNAAGHEAIAEAVLASIRL
ncbi:SGNH/GDSL hydrolase family protein [Actinoplanes sp. L3-i22]|uniref:SGNH/GDSL hydrolase family protein n=1 Tax=Actinoplanes sp. L3-i22 TaxID=2836373 RepID=UPI0021077F0D|nr:SGNH/GDSL hydrolase family protein [Actinoplanes sp. L3-i22]